MKRNILLQFNDEDDYADVLVAMRSVSGTSPKDPAERGAAIAAICRDDLLASKARAVRERNGSPLPGHKELTFTTDD